MKKTLFIFFCGLFLVCGGYATSKTIRLNKIAFNNSPPLNRVLHKRRSIREFNAKRKLSLAQISRLLWAGQGITNARGFRTAPSAGALYPLELYILKHDGVWWYKTKTHSLHLVKKGDFRWQLARIALGQKYIKEAPIVIVIAADYSRTTKKYGDRGFRYVQIEAGAALQNILLEATGLGVGAVPVGAFYGRDVIKLLDLPRKVDPLLVVPIGYSKQHL